jgi:hypothetical protein
MSTSATTTAEDLKTKMGTYLDAFLVSPINYNAIQSSLLASDEGMSFLTVLSDNQGALAWTIQQWPGQADPSPQWHFWINRKENRGTAPTYRHGTSTA